MRYLVLLILFPATFFSLIAQNRLSDDMKDTEEKLLASTKQINQFFRRFNGEEDQQGKRFHSGDKGYRDPGLRKNYLPVLFDSETGNVSENLAKDFIKEVTDKRDPSFLNFHSGDWFAEVNTVFHYNGTTESVLLYLKIQKQGLGHEWVITDVAFAPFQELFNKDTTHTKKFIHPMSHELDFMNLRKAFQKGNPESYTAREYNPDYLTLFLYEMKRGNLKFEAVKNVKFHFFEIEGWYFELANFNRKGFNTGWLISNLVKADSKEKELLKAYIYDKN